MKPKFIINDLVCLKNKALYRYDDLTIKIIKKRFNFKKFKFIYKYKVIVMRRYLPPNVRGNINGVRYNRLPYNGLDNIWFNEDDIEFVNEEDKRDYKLQQLLNDI